MFRKQSVVTVDVLTFIDSHSIKFDYITFPSKIICICSVLLLLLLLLLLESTTCLSHEESVNTMKNKFHIDLTKNLYFIPNRSFKEDDIRVELDESMSEMHM